MKRSADAPSQAADAPAQPKRKRKKKEKPTCERDCRHLYCLRGTYDCALEGCVPCAYKLCLHSDPERPLPPPERPEQCLRVRRGGDSGDRGRVFGGRTVLTVGDGDCSFSLAIAGACARLDASTLAPDEDALCGLYEGLPIRAHVAKLRKAKHCRLLFGVDATDLAAAPKINTYDRVVFNFPCLPVAAGQDGQNPDSKVADAAALDANRDLVRRFARSALAVLAPGGEVHVSHKTIEPYKWWGFPDLVTDAEAGLAYRGAYVFDRASFPPYANRKACDRASFTATDAVTYVYAGPGDASSATLPPRSEAPPDAAAPPFHRGPLAPPDTVGAFLRVDPPLLARVRDAQQKR